MTQDERQKTEARIAAETCSRLVEWRELSGEQRVRSFLDGLSTLGKKNPLALKIACEMIAGSNETLSRRFEDLGPTRQAAHKRITAAMRTIRTHWPIADDVVRYMTASRPRGPQSSAGLRKYRVL
jgi:hypothetical protein